MLCREVSLVGAFLGLLLAHADAQEIKPFGLTVAYADGRTTVTPLRPVFDFWTPYFARTPETDPNVRAVDISGTRDGDDAVVTVSVMLGGTSLSDRVAVATVHVSVGSPVEVTALGRYGVPPVRIALVPLERPSILAVPQVITPSGQLEIDVHQIADHLAYHVSVINHGRTPIRALQYRTMRQGEQEGSGRKRDTRDLPLVVPGGTYQFDVPVSAQTADQAALGVWRDWDQFEVTSVLWDDGLVEGDEELKISEWRLYAEKRRLMPGVLKWFREAQSLSITDARRRLDELLRADRGNQLRTAMTEDLVAFTRAHAADDTEAFHLWAAQELGPYTEWLSRLNQFLNP